MSFRGLHANRTRLRVSVLLLGLTIVAGACGSSGNSKAISTTETTVSESSTTAQGGTSGTESTTTTGATDATSTVPPTSAAEANPPETPTGLFLNTHTLSLGGADAPSAGQSVCKTSPGARCEIRFTSNSGTKTLGAKVAGTDGIVEWSWTPADAGLTVGHWNVDIVATRGAATATANDPLGLQIEP